MFNQNARVPFLRMQTVFLALALVIISGFASAQEPKPTSLPVYWPTDAWRTSTPEQQGMDSAQLARMFAEINQQHFSLNSVLIIRHGYLVTEVYVPPFQADTKRKIYSITKSIISALVGIALDQGYLHDVNQKALDFFTDRTIANNDTRKHAITLKHLLTMTSGLQPSTQDRGDIVQKTLNLPMVAKPGVKWDYNTDSTHLLSAILQKVTGQSALAFAQTQIFTPLGITDVAWSTDANGVNIGGSALKMTPRDLAKFGYLYLHGGVWNGRQVVPRDWVQTSTAKQVDCTEKRGYGYLWWQMPFGGYAALGYGGQEILVFPEHDLVVVFTTSPMDEKKLWKLVSDFILPAVRSGEPLPDNPKGMESLESQIMAIEG